MESENLIFLTLFLSLLFCVWGAGSLPARVEQSTQNERNVSDQALDSSMQSPGGSGGELFPRGNFPISSIWGAFGQEKPRPSFSQLFNDRGAQPPPEGAEPPTVSQSVDSLTLSGVATFKPFKYTFSFFVSSFFVFVANILLSFFLLSRWIESGHPPFSNLYESFLFLAWSLLLFYFPATGFWAKSGEKNEGPQSSNRSGPELRSQNSAASGFAPPPVSSLAGIVLVSAALFIYTFATWILPSEMRELKPLVPALKSNWLLMHVSIMLLSYSALIAGCLFSILYLVLFYTQKKNIKRSPSPLFVSPRGAAPRRNSPEGNPGGAVLTSPRRSPLSSSPSVTRFLTDLDALSYRSLAFAFPLLTLGIISGAVWANEAWGSYWSWDPKETWALITWFLFSIYLHLRIQKSWEGEKAALVALFGFFIVWICYLGVNLLGKGLHSYGWWAGGS